MEDDIWIFDEEAFENDEYHDYEDYDDDRIDLSDEINNGHRVRDLRLLDGISAETLAKRINITVKELLAIESGMLHLDQMTAEDIADQLQVNLVDIWAE
ncbi:MAG: helix-turn-helix domain-containing protein [Granulosicoccus sp.]